MDKRYQVFVSSTYTDLMSERQAVIQTLLGMDCIPSGMELFPAADEEQWQFIQRVVDDCDYYILIIKGRYGSAAPDGTSYTEKEYDYAVSRGMQVLAFVYTPPPEATPEPSSEGEEAEGRLQAFKERVMNGRLAKHWSSGGELQGLVALSLQRAMKMHPSVGWVRGDQVSSVEMLTEVHALKKSNEELRSKLEELESRRNPEISNLATMDEAIELHGTYWASSMKGVWSVALPWAKLFALIGPSLLSNPGDSAVPSILAAAVFPLSGHHGNAVEVADQDFQTVKIQLMAYGLIVVNYLAAVGGGAGLFWNLTPLGHSTLMELRAVRSHK